MQFIDTLEANIFDSLNTVANATILKVSPGSNATIVDNCVSFIGADAHAAAVGQAAFANMTSTQPGVANIYGMTFGVVIVTNIHQSNSTSCMSEFPFLYSVMLCNAILCTKSVPVHHTQICRGCDHCDESYSTDCRFVNWSYSKQGLMLDQQP